MFPISSQVCQAPGAALELAALKAETDALKAACRADGAVAAKAVGGGGAVRQLCSPLCELGLATEEWRPVRSLDQLYAQASRPPFDQYATSAV
jgi:hypothetical protein